MANKLETFLKYLVDRKEGYEKPVAYQDDEWYTRCEAKADILDEVIEEFKSAMKEENE